MPQSDEAAGVFDIIATEEHQAPAKPEPSVETKTAETKTEDAVGEHESALNGDTQDFSRNTEEAAKPTKTEAPEESSKEQDTKTEPLQKETETSETETKTNTEPVDDWKTNLPPPPQPYTGLQPEVDENGQLTNMTATEFTQYTVEKAKSEMRLENYYQQVENRALDAAEQILPELKTNPSVRNMLQALRVNQVTNGLDGDAVTAAKEIRALLGEYKAQGANNAKTHITVTKNAQVETPNNQTKTDTAKDKQLDKRLKAGDDSAFVELFNILDEQGKL